LGREGRGRVGREEKGSRGAGREGKERKGRFDSDAQLEQGRRLAKTGPANHHSYHVGFVVMLALPQCC